MTLCDTGPLVTLMNKGDSEHQRCVGIVNEIPTPLITTWPCLTEAMYLLGKRGGIVAQKELWEYFDAGVLTLHLNTEEERIRIRVLMNQYHDAPMDLADASLVAAAEVLNISQIFTLDKHFHAYRIHDAKPFEVVP